MTAEDKQAYFGKVVSGANHMSKRMSAGSMALDLYENFTGVELVPGSLNVELEQEVYMPPYSQEIVRNDNEGEAIIYITPALLSDLHCFVVRNKKVEYGKGRHSARVVEIISAYNLRERLDLEDGDKITVQF